MALNEGAVLVVGRANFFTAPVGTPPPEDLRSPSAPWGNIGFTSVEEILGFSSEGGEATTIDTPQRKAIRKSYSTRVDTINLTLQQWDKDSLKLHFGENMIEIPNGMLGVPLEPRPSHRAFLCIVLDGENVFGIYAPLVEIFRRDVPTFPDMQNPAGLPVSITPLQYGENSWSWALTPLGGPAVATTAVAGEPGYFLPEGAAPPADLVAMQENGVAPDPESAWPTGSYVLLGDGTPAHWDGEAWVGGIAD